MLGGPTAKVYYGEKTAKPAKGKGAGGRGPGRPARPPSLQTPRTCLGPCERCSPSRPQPARDPAPAAGAGHGGTSAWHLQKSTLRACAAPRQCQVPCVSSAPIEQRRPVCCLASFCAPSAAGRSEHAPTVPSQRPQIGTGIGAVTLRPRSGCVRAWLRGCSCSADRGSQHVLGVNHISRQTAGVGNRPTC